ncbi:hypothetical protein SDC9_75685 [bioreactor metagenome]|uniref:Sulfatase-modifying factor enzyme domain-containing protein n=1 Tax=bioreactor metagenome TaxID=1076179 RepID=A0A644YKN9_9ZZZZ
MRNIGNGSALPLRGGNWGNTTGAGVFALNVNESRANSSHNVGFRAALLSKPDSRSLRVPAQSRENKGTCFRGRRQSVRKYNLMEAASSPRARAVTHEKSRIT